MKTLTTFERICILAITGIVCLGAGYIFGASSDRAEKLADKLKLQEKEVARLAHANADLNSTVSDLKNDLARARQTTGPTVARAPDVATAQPVALPQRAAPAERRERPTASNVEIADMGMTIIETFDTLDSIRVGFKAKLTNRNTEAIGLRVTFLFKSADGFELESVPILGTQYIKPGESKDVAGRYVFDKSVYDRIETYVASIKLD